MNSTVSVKTDAKKLMGRAAVWGLYLVAGLVTTVAAVGLTQLSRGSMNVRLSAAAPSSVDPRSAEGMAESRRQLLENEQANASILLTMLGVTSAFIFGCVEGIRRRNLTFGLLGGALGMLTGGGICWWTASHAVLIGNQLTLGRRDTIVTGMAVHSLAWIGVSIGIAVAIAISAFSVRSLSSTIINSAFGALTGSILFVFIAGAMDSSIAVDHLRQVNGRDQMLWGLFPSVLISLFAAKSVLAESSNRFNPPMNDGTNS